MKGVFPSFRSHAGSARHDRVAAVSTLSFAQAPETDL